MKIALIIFTRNEKRNLESIFSSIPFTIVDKTYAVDGNSTDGTQDFFKRKHIPVIKQKYKGVGGAYEAAFANTKEDALIFFHPDGNMDPKDIDEFSKRLKKGQQFIIATRMTQGGVNEEDIHFLKPRKWFCQTLCIVANILYGKNGNEGSDITQGYRAITRTAWEKMAISCPDPIAPDFEQVIIALKKAIKIDEFPTKEGLRKFGTTSMPSMRTGWANIKVLLKQVRDNQGAT